MFNLSIFILQIKVSGFNLLDIKTINIVIICQEGRINKGNSDIEIDNDILVISLTQEESDKLKGNGASISISATDYSNVDVSNKIKIVWVKRGKRSNFAGISSVSEEIFNQTISNINISINDLENGFSIGNSRVYLDYQDGKYGVNTDPDRGADTFSPFKSGADVSEGAVFIDSEYDTPTNVFATMTQIGVYNGKIIEKNPLWSEIVILNESVFSTDFEKINIEVEEG